MDGPFSLGFDYDVWGNMTHRYGWGGEVQGGSAGQSSDLYYSYGSSNRRSGFSYDAAGNLTNDLGQTFTYDATGQQVTASYSGYSLQQAYDGNGLRVKKTENGSTTYYLRSSIFGAAVVAEIVWTGSSWSWSRGYVYSGTGLLAVQSGGAVSWVHEDPITKSKRITNSAGTVISSIELDPWGADVGAAWSSNSGFQPRKFTTYDRDGNGSDEAMFRRHNRWHARFDQPDPYDGSYDLTNPQSFNRYAYVQNDPVNFVDPLGLDRFDDHLGPPPPVPTQIPYGGTIVTNTRAPRPPGGGGGVSSGPIEIETPSTPTEAELVPQTPAPAQTDCQRFADLVQAIANRTNSDDEFLDEMARTFTAANNSSIADMRRTANTAIPAGRPRFVDSGFKPEFQDGSNQVRHFTAGFIAGARLGVPGLMYMNSREGGHNPSPGNEPDVRLNGVSTNLGSMYTQRPDAVEFRRARLAGQIREDVCQ